MEMNRLKITSIGGDLYSGNSKSSADDRNMDKAAWVGPGACDGDREMPGIRRCLT